MLFSGLRPVCLEAIYQYLKIDIGISRSESELRTLAEERLITITPIMQNLHQLLFASTRGKIVFRVRSGRISSYMNFSYKPGSYQIHVRQERCVDTFFDFCSCMGDVFFANVKLIGFLMNNVTELRVAWQDIESEVNLANTNRKADISVVIQKHQDKQKSLLKRKLDRIFQAKEFSLSRDEVIQVLDTVIVRKIQES